jgi:ATP-dependent 26S proteasome regulatory subunit
MIYILDGESDSELFYYLELYFGKNIHKAKYFDIKNNKVIDTDINIIRKISEYNENKVEKLRFVPPFIPNIIYLFDFNNIELRMSINYVDKPFNNSNNFQIFKIMTLECDNEEDLKEIIQIIYNEIVDEDMNVEDKNKLHIFMRKNKSNGFNHQLSQNKREMNTVFLENKLKDRVINDIEKFIDSKEDYIKFGQSYKRNYLFYGPPGSGKTSFIYALASKFDFKIFIINITPDLTNDVFINLIQNIESKKQSSILILEDIDALFKERKTSNEHWITFSGILNIFDGIFCKEKLLIFLTTNHKELLDPALLRPGRIDYILEFEMAKKEQIEQMYEYFFKDKKIFEQFWRAIRHYSNLTTAYFQKFFFEFRKSENIMEHIDYFHEIVKQHSNEDKPKEGIYQ